MRDALKSLRLSHTVDEKVMLLSYVFCVKERVCEARHGKAFEGLLKRYFNK